MNAPKSLKRHAAEGFFITFAGDSLNKGLGLVTTFVTLLVLVPYDYGIWRLLQSVLGFMSIVGLSGIAGVAVADLARELGRGDKPRAYAITWRAGQILIAASIAATVVLMLAAPVISSISKINLSLYLWILSCSLLFGGILQVLQISFQARLEPMRALVLKNVGNFSYLVAIILFMPYLNLSVLGLAIAYVIAMAVPVFVFLPYALKQYRIILRERDRTAYSTKEVLVKRGGWALGSDFISILESSAWPWLVGYFLSIEQVAYAGLAIVIASQVYSIVPVQYLLRGILPRFTADKARMHEWVVRVSRYSLWLHLLAALGIFAAMSILVLGFFPTYAPALPIVTALLIAVPFRAIGAVVVEWMYAVRNQRGLFLTTAVPRIAWLIALPVLLAQFQMNGFIIWYLGSSLTILFARFIMTASGIRLPLSPRALLLPDATDWRLLRDALARLRSRKGQVLNSSTP